MNNLKNFYRSISAMFAVLTIAILVSLFPMNNADASITNNLGLGSTGSEVTQLQQFLATDGSVYPLGLVPGYFGPATKAAVVQFQAAYDISQVGTVGPVTKAKINSIMLSGFGLDTRASIMSKPTLQVSNNNATISWNTNELTRGQVYYDSNPLRLDEATGHAQLPYISGVLAINGVSYSYSQSIAINGLQPNTVYYYTARSIDNSGNVTMSWTDSFRTNY